MDRGGITAIAALLVAPGLLIGAPIAAALGASAGVTSTRPLTVQAPLLHADPRPPGLSVRRSSTSNLLLTAGFAPLTVASGRTAVRRPPASPPFGVPSGTPTTLGLTAHVRPGCTGTGSDGNRVQVAYVTETGRVDRFGSVLPALQSFVADVDDVTAKSSAETGGGRRIRWVHNSACSPTILHIVLPAGSLAAFGTTINAMLAKNYTSAARKYLMYVEDDMADYCGIAQVYGDSTKSTANYNNGRAPMFAAVESGCWSLGVGSHSVAAHELMHSLGAVMDESPNSSQFGHCTDDADVMCYVDGPGVVVRNVCTADHEQLYDCNHDDYFSTNPGPTNYLSTHWNTADSSFLDTVPILGSPPPVLPVRKPPGH